ncbi:RNA 2',3'-cyclic phosphodiesterase [Candidatus Woesearchaeota archaeon]|nr:RNA 2',3'-cyclic phosphodiesterase [Candidatus Woesearchaeota archaeon]
MRLFIAIDLPEEVKQVIEEIKKPIKDIKGVKPVRKQNLHLTMKFLGEIEDDKVKKIVEALGKVEFKPFNLSLGKLGFFPNEKRIRVLWIDAVPAEPLKILKQEIDKALPEFKDDHPFKNHLTFARIKYIASEEDKKNILELITNTAVEKKEFLVDKFVLYKSTLMPEGPVYKVLGLFPESEKPSTKIKNNF